ARRVNRDLELKNGNDNGGGNGNGDGSGNGNGNGNGGGVRNGNNEGDNSDGTEGVVGLIRWSEKMETVFHISNFPERYQMKYATCTLLDSALTWWNSHKRTIRTDAAYALSWRELMTEVYCLKNEIQKMENELWNLSVKNNDMATYTQRFQELIMMCTKMVPEEEDRVEKYQNGPRGGRSGGEIHWRAYAVGNNEKKEYDGPLPFCNKCKLHHEGPSTKDCPKIKNKNHGNKARVPDARGKAYVIGGGGTNPGSNTVTDLGSFDVIIGMDWLAKNHAVIVCDGKIVRIPYGNKILIVQGDKSDKEKKSTLSIISCVKA
ncbi:putative reverse transcriptase domain-containing protein, partial [Tanacetum coccineum]